MTTSPSDIVTSYLEIIAYLRNMRYDVIHVRIRAQGYSYKCSVLFYIIFCENEVFTR